ncbi:hypothetical protein [Plesiomonas shigelloides]|uniref:hypothetical protein n=1 Tax=Plesiomonas shigelloides TaxID=703 RepID=UPI000A115E63|nr:hypothetical protein [Plesiomonas shigelloides]
MDKNSNNSIFKNDNFKAIPSGFYTATHMQYVSKDGEVIDTKITSDFKLLYGFLFDQCRSFGAQDGVNGEKQDFYQDWDTIFLCIGRRYADDKNSKRLVKLLEDSGILVQTKRPNTTNTNKVVFDVTTLNNIKFYNPDRDAWEADQHKRRADRKREYEEAKAQKLAAIEQAKQQHNICIPAEPKQKAVPTIKPVCVEPEPVTLWAKYKDTLIASNRDRWENLGKGLQQHVMIAVNDSVSDNYVLIKNNFDTAISIAMRSQQPKSENVQVQTVKQSENYDIDDLFYCVDHDDNFDKYQKHTHNANKQETVEFDWSDADDEFNFSDDVPF